MLLNRVRSSASRARPWPLAAAAVAALALPAVAAAAVVPTNWSRADEYASYHGWNTFTSPTGTPTPNAPDLGSHLSPASATAVAANAYDASGASFVTSGGNIYSPTAVVNARVDVPSYNLGGQYVTTVLLQVRSLGSELQYTGANGVRLSYPGSGGFVYPVDQGELEPRVALGGFGGTQITRSFLFRLPASPSQLNFFADAAGSSMSLDQVAVDAVVTRASAAAPLLSGMNPTIGYVPQPVPEPTAAGLLAAGAGLLLGRRRRRAGR